MVFSEIHKLELPDEFPMVELAAFMNTAKAILLEPTKSEAWKEFGGASNLIGWRYRACYESMKMYITLWNEGDSNRSFENKYRQELALFGMFTAGVSCIESTCYGLHAMASHSRLLKLSFGDREQRNTSPKVLGNLLRDYSTADKLVHAIDSLIDSDKWKIWVESRNRMSHRSNLPRIIRGAAGVAPPSAKPLQFAATSSSRAFEGDVGDLEDMFNCNRSRHCSGWLRGVC